MRNSHVLKTSMTQGGFQAEHGQSVPGFGGAAAPAALFVLS